MGLARYILVWILRLVFPAIWLVLILLTLVQVPGIRQEVVSFALDQVNSGLRGTIRLGTVSGDLLTGFVLDSAEVLDEQGRLVAATELVSVSLEPGELLSLRLHLPLVVIQGPSLVSPDRLLQALEPLEQSRPKPDSGRSSGFELVLDRVLIDHGRLGLPGFPLGDLEEIQVDLSLFAGTEGPRADLDLASACVLTSLYPDPVCLAGEVTVRGTDLGLDLLLEVDEQEVAATANLSYGPEPGGGLSLQASRLRVAAAVPELAMIPQLEDVGAVLGVTLDQGEVAAEGELVLGASRIMIAGIARPEQKLGWVELGIRNLSLAPPLIPVPVTADLDLTVDADGIDRVDGAVHFPRLRVLGLALDELRVTGRVRRGDLLGTLALPLPGAGRLRLEAERKAGEQHLEARLEVRELDLARISELGLPLIEGLAGVVDSLTLIAHFDPSGQVPTWTGDLSLKAREPGFQGLAAGELLLDAAVSGEGTGEQIWGRVQAQVRHLAGLGVDSASVLISRDKAGLTGVSGQVQMKDLSGSVRVSAAWPDLRNIPELLTIEALDVAAGPYRLVTGSQAVLRAVELSRFQLEPLKLALNGIEFQVRAGFDSVARSLEAVVDLRDQDLALILGLAGLEPLSGRVSSRIGVSGSLADPRIRGWVGLEGLEGASRELVRALNLDLDLAAGLARLNLEGDLKGEAGLSLQGEARLGLSLDPFALTLPEFGEVGLIFRQVELSDLVTLAPQVPLEQGVLSGEIQVRGSPWFPFVSANLAASGLELQGLKPLDLALDLALDPWTSGLKLLVRAGEGRIKVAGEVPTWRLTPAPETIDEWIRRIDPEKHRFRVSSSELRLDRVLRGWSGKEILGFNLEALAREDLTVLETRGWVRLGPKDVGKQGRPHDRLDLSGAFDLKKRTLTADLDLKNLDLAAVSRLVPGLRLRGILSAGMTVRGPASAPRIQGRIDLRGFSPTPELRLGRVHGTIGLDQRGGRAGLTTYWGRLGKLKLDLKAGIKLSLEPFQFSFSQSRTSLDLEFESLKLTDFKAFLPEGLGLDGVAGGRVHVALPLSKPRVDLSLGITGLRVPSLASLDLNVKAAMDDKVATLEVSAAHGDRVWMTLSAIIPPISPEAPDLVQWRSRWQGELHHIRGNIEETGLGTLLPAWTLPGNLSAELEVKDSLGIFSFKVGVDGLEILAHKVGLFLSGQSDLNLAGLELAAVVDGQPAGSVIAVIRAAGDEPWLLEPMNALVDARMDLSQVASRLLDEYLKPLGIFIQGPLSLTGRSTGSPSDLRPVVALSAGKLTLADISLENLELTAEVTPEGAKGGLSASSGGAGRLTGEFSLDATCLSRSLVSGCDVLSAPVAAEVSLTGITHSLLKRLLPRGYIVEFDARSRGYLAGTISTPRLAADVDVALSRLKIPFTGWDLKDIPVHVSADESRVSLTPVVLRVGDGTAAIKGDVNLKTRALDCSVVFDDFLLADRNALRVVIRGEAGLRGTLDAPVLYGDLTVVEAHVRDMMVSDADLHPTQLSNDVIFVDGSAAMDPFLAFISGASGGTGEQETPSTQKESSVSGEIAIHIPGRFFFKASGADLELRGDLLIALEDMIPRITGEITTVRGQVEVFGRVFKLSRARVEFSGSEDLDPILDVVAAMSISEVDLSSYGLETTPDSNITITVGGRVSSPEVQLSSSPAMSQDQIMTILVMGQARGVDQTGGAGAAGLLAGLLAKPLEHKLAGKLPVDTLNVVTGSKGVETARVSAGKYLAPWLFIGYAYQFGAEEDQNRNEVHLEIRFSSHILLETVYGDAGAGSGDFIYRINY